MDLDMGRANFLIWRIPSRLSVSSVMAYCSWFCGSRNEREQGDRGIIVRQAAHSHLRAQKGFSYVAQYRNPIERTSKRRDRAE